MEKLGFVGLGTMGGPMCSNLLVAGHDVVAFDLDDGAVDAQVELGAQRVESAAEVAANCDVLLTSLPRPDHVEAVMLGADALASLRSGSLWIDLTTNRVQLLHEMQARAPEGVSIVDCPVTGAVDGARNASLTLFLGGDAPQTARARPIVDRLGKVIECGGLGTGNVVKLVTNQLWFIHAAAIGEAMALGMTNGVELAVLWEAMKESVGDSFVARHDAPSIFAGHYDPSFPLDLCLKDLGLIEELGARVGTELSMTEAAHANFREAENRYGGSAGELHVARRLEDDTGLSFRLDGEWVPHWEK